MDGCFAANERSQQLFVSLLERVQAGSFDDVFLEELVEYHKAFPESERYDIFYARYALAHGAVKVALEAAKMAYEKRKVCFEIWRILSECYHTLNEPLQAALFDGLLACHAGQDFSGTLPRDELQTYLDILSLAMSDPRPMIFMTREMFLDGPRGLQGRSGGVVGRYLPMPADRISDSYRLWSGVYNRSSQRNEIGNMMDLATREGLTEGASYGSFTFDVMKSRETSSCVIRDEVPCILPVAGKNIDQKLRIYKEGFDKETSLAKSEYSFFRVEEPTTFEAAEPFAVAEPIRLRHDPRRKKLVLNIFIDSLAWSVVKQHDYQWMPRTMEFFSKGIIFNNNYSVAEYTYPSLASIETGLSLPHTQLFNPKVLEPLSDSVKTLSERMKDAGYYCSMLSGGVALGIGNGILRGFDRMLLDQYFGQISVAVERTIQHLEAFGETDEFIMFDVDDVHPNSSDFPNSEQAQTKISLEDRLSVDNDRVSVLLAKSKLNEYQNEQNIKRVDRSLGYLYDYLTSHYSDDEYVVHLYSDHGASVYSEKPWFLSEEQNCAAFMMRGGDIPALGLVEELTSDLDIYPCVLHNAGLAPTEGIDGVLPKALGGPGREYVISSSIYPGQTFKLCIRTQQYEFRWEAKALTRFDGRIDRSKFTYELYTRDAEHRAVRDEAAENKFLAIAEEYTRSLAENGECWPGEEK